MSKYGKGVFIDATCYKCGKPVRRRLKKHKPQKYFICDACFHNISNPNLVGGTLDPDGYVKLTVDGRRIFEHRAVMEKHLGRELKPSELVHHLNGIRTDNRLENLAIVDSKSHPRKSYIQILQERIRFLESELEKLTVGSNYAKG
jgi:hypothetical protein